MVIYLSWQRHMITDRTHSCCIQVVVNPIHRLFTGLRDMIILNTNLLTSCSGVVIVSYKNWPPLQSHSSLGGTRPPSQGTLSWPKFMCILCSYVESYIRYVLGNIRWKELMTILLVDIWVPHLRGWWNPHLPKSKCGWKTSFKCSNFFICSFSFTFSVFSFK